MRSSLMKMWPNSPKLSKITRNFREISIWATIIWVIRQLSNLQEFLKIETLPISPSSIWLKTTLAAKLESILDKLSPPTLTIFCSNYHDISMELATSWVQRTIWFGTSNLVEWRPRQWRPGRTCTTLRVGPNTWDEVEDYTEFINSLKAMILMTNYRCTQT